MKLSKSKLALSLLTAAITLFLIGICFHGYMNKGAQAVALRDANAIYFWRAGSLRVKGPVTPESCALNTKQCGCILRVVA